MICIAIVEYPYVTGPTRIVLQVPANALPGDAVWFRDYDKFRFGEIVSVAKMDDTDPVLEMFDTLAHGGKLQEATALYRKVAEEA